MVYAMVVIAEGFGSLLKTLNELGIVAYAKRQATVRLAVPIADEESVEPVVVRLVQRDTPYSNRRHRRETLREAEAYVWWADPHYDKSALEPLSDEADPTRISAIRILTGSMPSPAEIASHYRPFIDEMANRGITVEIRVVPGPDRDWHDRFIVSKERGLEHPADQDGDERRLQRVHKDGQSTAV